MHARGQQAFRTQKSHEEYGPVVRVGPNHLSFTDPRAWRDIYAYRATGEMAKADAFFRPMKGLPSSILNADIEEHSRIRRALAQGFSDASMRAQETLITSYVRLLVERLTHETAGGQSVQNMAAWCTYQLRTCCLLEYELTRLQTIGRRSIWFLNWCLGSRSTALRQLTIILGLLIY
jgi:cytochrome P450